MVRVQHKFGGMRDKVYNRGGMWDTRNFKSRMRDKNREAGPGYAPFGRRDKGLDGYRRDKGLDGYRRDHYLAPVKSHSMLNLSPLQTVERKQLLRQISQL